MKIHTIRRCVCVRTQPSSTLSLVISLSLSLSLSISVYIYIYIYISIPHSLPLFLSLSLSLSLQTFLSGNKRKRKEADYILIYQRCSLSLLYNIITLVQSGPGSNSNKGVTLSAPELKHHHLIQFCDILKTFFFFVRSCSSTEDAVSFLGFVDKSVI